MTVRHLLTHTSGLPPFKEYWRTSKGKQDTLAKIFAEPLEYEPGTKEVYSDLGIILMAEIIERLTGRKLDDLAHDYIFSLLGMNNTMYRPPKKLWPQIAPTEIAENFAARDDRAIHDAATTFRRNADARLGCADRRRVERALFFGAQLWTHWIYRHFDLD